MDELKRLIETSDRILITTHISPDPDALSSLLLMGTTLATNFSDKRIVMSIEELTGDLEFLSGYQDVRPGKLIDAIAELRPELIIIVDAMSYRRCTRGDADEVRQAAESIGSKLAIIDHHMQQGRDESQVYINQGSPAAVQDVYEVCFKHLGLKKPDGYAQTTMLGIYSDTGGFIYDNPRHKDTFAIISELIEAGVSIEKVKNYLDRYSLESMRALSIITANLQLAEAYAYSFISDEWMHGKDSFDDVHLAVGVFANLFLRNIEGRTWGFIVYPDLLSGPGVYGVSFRAIAGTKDVSALANELGGGGHKAAAGAKIKAPSVQVALETIKQAVEKVGVS